MGFGVKALRPVRFLGGVWGLGFRVSCLGWFRLRMRFRGFGIFGGQTKLRRIPLVSGQTLLAEMQGSRGKKTSFCVARPYTRNRRHRPKHQSL